MPDPDLDNNAAYVRQVHDKGLRFDLSTMSRRRMLTVLGGAGAAIAVGGFSAGNAAAADTLEEVESETAGPYPADGSNGPDVRTLDGIVRKDIRSSFGTASGTAAGVPLEFSLTVLDLTGAPVAGAAVYAWHCDRDGNYSLYSTGITDQNYLRGIQVTDATGTVSFTSIFPACYSGRWPHIHFEVYRSLAVATQGTNSLKTSQMALLKAPCNAVYDGDFGYTGSKTAFSKITLASDSVFGDDLAAHEKPTMKGSADSGYSAHLVVGI